MNKPHPDTIIDAYTVAGVPQSSLPALCKELNINEARLHEWLDGQTMMVIGGEGIVYPSDLKKFVRGLTNND